MPPNQKARSECLGNLDRLDLRTPSRAFDFSQQRIDRKQYVVVLKGVTMRPGQPFKVDALQATLDQEDGLQTETRFDCDLLYTLEKKDITQKRGEVRSLERKRDISRKMIQGLAIAGL